MRIRTILIGLVALGGLGLGGLLTMRAMGAYASEDGGGIAQAISGVMRNGLSAFGEGDVIRIRTASSAADETDAADQEDGEDKDSPSFIRKRVMKIPAPGEVHIEHLRSMQEGFDDEPGVLVSGVKTDGPAALAGLSRGDIIVGIDNTTIETLDDLHDALADRQGGEVVSVDVLHGDERLTLNVTLEDLEGSAWLGIAPCGGGMFAIPSMQGIGPLDMELHMDGARIMGLEPGGPAESAGVLEGEVIKSVDGAAVDPMNDLGDVLSEYSPGDTVTLTLAPAAGAEFNEDAPGEDGSSETVADTREVSVTLGEHPSDPDRAFLGVHYGIEINHDFGGDHSFSFDLSELEDLDGNRFKGIGPNIFKWFGGSGPGEMDGMGMEHFSLEGAIVSELNSDGPAASAGLGEGDVITSIDGEDVDSPEALADLVSARSPGETVTLSVKSMNESEQASEPREITVVLGEHPEKDGAGWLGVTVAGFLSIERFMSPDGEGEDGASFHFGPEHGGGMFRFFHGSPESDPIPADVLPLDGGTL